MAGGGSSAAPLGGPAFAELTADALRLRVRVQARASRTRVIGPHGGTLKVAVSAPPVDGAANLAVIAAIAEWLGIARSCVELVQGETSRSKTLRLSGHPATLLLERLTAALSSLR